MTHLGSPDTDAQQGLTIVLAQRGTQGICELDLGVKSREPSHCLTSTRLLKENV